MENWIYHLQGRAVGEIQPISSWSHSPQHLKGSHVLVLQLPWKLQPKVSRAQQNLWAHGILYIPAVSVFLALKPSRRASGACTSAPGSPAFFRTPKRQQYSLKPHPAYPQESHILYILEIILYYPKYYYL